MKQVIEDFDYFKREMIEQFYRKIATVEQLLKDKGLDNRINQIIDITDYIDDLIICDKIGYTDDSMCEELVLCYYDSGRITINKIDENDIISTLDMNDLVYFNYEDIFDNLNFVLDKIIESASEGYLYLNYK